MKKTFYLFWALVLLGYIPIKAQADEKVVTLDRIVAVVNEDVITSLELQEKVDELVHKLRMSDSPTPPPSYIRSQVLNNMISIMVQLQLAEKTGIRLDSGEVNKTLAMLAKRNDMSLDEFVNEIEKEGTSFEKFKQQLHDEMIIARLRERDVSRHVQITDGEIERYMISHAESLFSGYEYHIEHLVLKNPSAKTLNGQKVEQVKRAAKEILDQLKNGMTVADYLSRKDINASLVSGGDLGWLALDHMPRIYAEHVIGLKEGEFSPIIHSERGEHIIHLVGIRTKEGAPSLEEIREKAHQELFVSKAEENGKRWLKQLTDEAYIEIRL
ncbi:MAG: hypothetical protein D6698_09700 [Gammaproteobacteria bacterium]|nr:MAG: hypothetical protein D6698_09700 [Gammaproteobacteria bacterium]